MTSETTTIVIPENGDRVLLGMKKRAFGRGRWNGAGGKLKAGESVEEVAKREVEEEFGLTGGQLVKIGYILFTLQPEDLQHQTHIFVLHNWQGEPRETEEMRPEWFPKSAIPLSEMWEADTLWVPLLLRGKKFRGTVQYQNQHLVSHDIHEIAEI